MDRDWPRSHSQCKICLRPIPHDYTDMASNADSPMPALIRRLAAILLLISTFVYLAGLASVLYVRSAIADGALENGMACISPADRAKLEGGPQQATADWYIWRSVYEHRVGENRRPNVGWRGAFAYLGTKLAMSPAERVDLASAARLCEGRTQAA